MGHLCASWVVSFNVYKKHNTKIHANDIDKFRLKIYNNKKDEKGTDKNYKLQDELFKNGEENYSTLKGGKSRSRSNTEYNAYVIS